MQTRTHTPREKRDRGGGGWGGEREREREREKERGGEREKSERLLHWSTTRAFSLRNTVFLFSARQQQSRDLGCNILKLEDDVFNSVLRPPPSPPSTIHIRVHAPALLKHRFASCSSSISISNVIYIRKCAHRVPKSPISHSTPPIEKTAQIYTRKT